MAQTAEIPVQVPGESELFIGSRWVAPTWDRTVEVVSPTTEDVVARVPDPSMADADRAVAAARSAFDEGPWPRMTFAERAPHIRRFCDEIEARFDQLGTAWTTECGATVEFREAINRGIGKVAWDDFLERAGRFEPREVRNGGAAGPVEVRHEPIGVVVNILTYNAPVGHVGLKVVPALLAGCVAIVKPAPETQLVAHILSDAAAAAELPRGIVSVLAAGPEVSRHLAAHPGVDMVNFTGGSEIGVSILQSVAPRIGRVTLELGGKSAGIVSDDIPLEELMPPLLGGILRFGGQISTALTRILVSTERHDEIVGALAAAFEAQRIGDPNDPTTDWGPLAVQRAREQTERAVGKALQDRASLVTGGRRPAGFDRGWFYEPTLLTDVDNSMAVAQDDIFGPVFSVIRYRDLDDAIRIANDSRFGLFGAVFTKDREIATKVSRSVRAGTFAVNAAGPCLTEPFGGMKQSGIGRECGVEGLLEYTETKSIVLGDL